jgi:hypothetical protein
VPTSQALSARRTCSYSERKLKVKRTRRREMNPYMMRFETEKYFNRWRKFNSKRRFTCPSNSTDKIDSLSDL